MMLPGVDLPIRLTPKEEKFILEYPQCNFNAAEAAIRAG
jgi:phage terminase small subunit